MQLLTSVDGLVWELAFAPNGRALAAIVTAQVPFLWDIPATAAPKALAEYRGDCDHLTFSADSEIVGWLAAGVRTEYERSTGEERKVQLLEGEGKLNSQAVTVPDGRLVIRTREPSGRFLRGFLPDSAGGWEEKWVVGPETDRYDRAITGTQTDRFFTVEMTDDTAHSWPRRLVARSALTGQIQRATRLPVDDVRRLVARPDGSEVAGFRESGLIVWRPGEKARKIRTGIKRHFGSIAYHPSGRYLLAVYDDTVVRVIDTDSWIVVKQYDWNVEGLWAVAVSPDGTLAAAGGENGQVVVWDLDL